MSRIAIEQAGKLSELKETGVIIKDLTLNRFNSRPKYYIRIHTQTTISNLLNYFQLYPIMNSKYHDYHDFVLIFNSILAREFWVRKHGLSNFTKLHNIIEGMNKSRVNVSWDFLWSFSYYYPISFYSKRKKGKS